MIKINFDPKEFFKDGAHADVWPEWDKLTKDADNATKRIVMEWEDYRLSLLEWKKNPVGSRPEFNPKFEEKIWKGFRDWMGANLFHDKCAYCETSIGEETIPDAEHFRPKAKVRHGSGDVIVPDEEFTEINHPGYFWLAYNWKNLLPSCHNCNRYEGKKSYFPVANSHVFTARVAAGDISGLRYDEIKSLKWEELYYLQPEDLNDREDPLLLHPIFDNPHEHISFDQNGKALVENESPKGRESIDTFAWNSPKRIHFRKAAQEEGYRFVMNKVLTEMESPETMKAAGEQALREYVRRNRPYAAAVFDYVRLLSAPMIAPERKNLFP